MMESDDSADEWEDAGWRNADGSYHIEISGNHVCSVCQEP